MLKNNRNWAKSEVLKIKNLTQTSIISMFFYKKILHCPQYMIVRAESVILEELLLECVVSETK